MSTSRPPGSPRARRRPLNVVRGVAHRLALADLGHSLAAARPRREPVERRDRLVARDAVGRQAGVRLELRQGADRGRTEDPVDAPGVEPQRAEPTLQLSDVVAPLHRAAQVQQPITELVAGFDDRGPRLQVADAIGLEARVRPGMRAPRSRWPPETTVLSVAGVEAGPGEPALKVADGFARRADAQGQTVYRNSPSSWRSWPLPLAPTKRFLACPSLNTMSVGMLMTS